MARRHTGMPGSVIAARRATLRDALPVAMVGTGGEWAVSAGGREMVATDPVPVPGQEGVWDLTLKDGARVYEGETVTVTHTRNTGGFLSPANDALFAAGAYTAGNGSEVPA